jgi:hypothetical protein
MLQTINPLISGAVGGLVISILAGITILGVAGIWRVYEKAGQPGWACLVPIYNLIVLLRIAGERWWCILLFLIPGINVVVHFLVTRDVARRFGRGTLFALGLFWAGFLFYPILGFGRAQYQPLA